MEVNKLSASVTLDATSFLQSIQQVVGGLQQMEKSVKASSNNIAAEAQKVGTQMEQAFKKLNLRPSSEILKDKADIKAAFETISKSGTLSFSELARAKMAMTSEMASLNKELSPLASGFSSLASAMLPIPGLALGAAAAFGAFKVGELVKDSTLLASRIEQLGLIMNVSGANIGLNKEQVDGYAKAIAATGINVEASRQSVVRMIQADINLAQSTELARAAQDAATVGNISSSEAFERITLGIATGQSRILHTMGITTNFIQAEVDKRRELGRELTEHEKKQVMLDEVLRASVNIQGAYKASMESAGKQLTTISGRYLPDLKAAFGEVFLPVFTSAVFDLADALKGLQQWFKDNADAIMVVGWSLNYVYTLMKITWIALKQIFNTVLFATNELALSLSQVLYLLAEPGRMIAGGTNPFQGWIDNFRATTESIRKDMADNNADAQKAWNALAGKDGDKQFPLKTPSPEKPKTKLDTSNIVDTEMQKLANLRIQIKAAFDAETADEFGKAMTAAQVKFEEFQNGINKAIKEHPQKAAELRKVNAAFQAERDNYDAAEAFKLLQGNLGKLEEQTTKAAIEYDKFTKMVGKDPWERGMLEGAAKAEESFIPVDRLLASIEKHFEDGIPPSVQAAIDKIKAAKAKLLTTETEKAKNTMIAEADDFLRKEIDKTAKDIAQIQATFGMGTVEAEMKSIAVTTEAEFVAKFGAAAKSVKSLADELNRLVTQKKTDAINKAFSGTMSGLVSAKEQSQYKSGMFNSTQYQSATGVGMNWGGSSSRSAYAQEYMSQAGNIGNLKSMMAELDPTKDAAALKVFNDQLNSIYDTIKINAELKVKILGEDELAAAQDRLSKLMDMKEGFREFSQGASSALTDFFMKFEETGKLDFGGLAKALLKTMQMQAAAKTATLLMEAMFCGIMGLIYTFTENPLAGLYLAAAAEAATGALVMGSFVLGSGLAAMAHDGIDNVPQDGTWLLQKGERVVDKRTNADLKQYLSNDNSRGNTVVNVSINNSDEQGVMKALPKLKETIIDAVNANIVGNGSIRHTIKAYT